MSRVDHDDRRVRRRLGMAARARQRGQASVELIGGLPILLVLGLVVLQLLAVGYAAVLAGVAAEAGALALASGDDPATAARTALPGWSRAGMRVATAGGRVRIALRPPSPLAVVAERLEVRAHAAVDG